MPRISPVLTRRGLLGASAAGGMFGIGWLAGAGEGPGDDAVQSRRNLDSCRGVGFPGTMFRTPRSWAEPNYHKLIDRHEGQFLIREQPDLSSAEVRTVFRHLPS